MNNLSQTILRSVPICTLLAFSVYVLAQEVECEVDTAPVLEQVSQVCKAMGQDRVCYGNLEVEAIPRPGFPDFRFELPGDSEEVVEVQSLYLSELSNESNVWGIAQLELTASNASGPHPLTMLLFGDVEATNEAQTRETFDVTVKTAFTINVRNLPSPQALLIGTGAPENTMEAVGRSEDSTWIRVRLPENGRLGWVSSNLIEPTTSTNTWDALTVDGAYDSYFGPMQAMTFVSGTDGCGTLTTDGLLVQTPEGVARVTILINEVTIELLGATTGTTAFVQADTTNGLGVQMLTGTGYVTAEGERTFLNTYDQTTVGMNDDMTPNSAPSIPTTGQPSDTNNIPALDILGYEAPPLPLPPTFADNDSEEEITPEVNMSIVFDNDESTTRGRTSDIIPAENFNAITTAPEENDDSDNGDNVDNGDDDSDDDGDDDNDDDDNGDDDDDNDDDDDDNDDDDDDNDDDDNGDDDNGDDNDDNDDDDDDDNDD